jgi:two-component system, NarL family, response regulator
MAPDSEDERLPAPADFFRPPEARVRSSEKLRLQVVDDVDVVRQLLCSILRSVPGFEVVSEAADAISGIRDAERFQPDVTILDISLPDMTGIDAVKRILEVAPSSEILLCSQHDLKGMVSVGLEAGARGYLLKSDAPQELVLAVRTIAKGERYVSSKIGAYEKSS